MIKFTEFDIKEQSRVV